MATFDGTSGPDTIDGTEDPDVIRGFGGDDTLRGHGGDDEIDGGDGNDTLDGGSGADRMTGGAGNDYYIVSLQGTVTVSEQPSGSSLLYPAAYLNSSQPDLITELSGGGTDTIWVPFTGSITAHNWFDYTLIRGDTLNASNHVERLGVYDQTTTYAVNLQGDHLNNEIWGNDGPNVLDGWTGADIMHGGGGDDIYFVDNQQDAIIESSGYDTVFFGRNPSWATPGPSTHYLFYTLTRGVERLIALESAGNVNLAGNDLANEIIGNDSANSLSGNDFIDSPLGPIRVDSYDVLIGMGGDDVYYLSSGITGQMPANVDRVIEYANGGHDRVETTFSYTLPDNVEDLKGFGTLTGNDLANVIGGANDNNIIDGRGGADIMRGLSGDDVYFVDDPGDQVFDDPSIFGGYGGYDTVFIANLDYVLPVNVERGAAVSPTSVEAFNLTGNDLDNELSGNDGANVLDGKLGLDTLIGYGGADTFAFTTVVDGHNADLFVGFEVGVDKVALDDAVFAGLTPGALPADAFVIGRFATDADDRILYEASTGDLFFDRDGTGPIEAQYFASMADGLSLTASDFIVI